MRTIHIAPVVTLLLIAIGLASGHNSLSDPAHKAGRPRIAAPQAPASPAQSTGTPPLTSIPRSGGAALPDVDDEVSPLPMPHHGPTPPVIHAASAILIDAVSGQVLYERNADVPRPMASTTKIMTALLFCEHVPDTAVISASQTACAVKESSLHLKPGEKLTAHDLLRAILMRSANDGCVAAAETVAGSESAFVRMMNERAEALGTTHTHFTNPHGLNDPLHYTTARDLALIARAAVQETRICEVVRTRQTRIKRSIDKRDVTLYNHSHFLGHFPGADGIKTGWTVPAGHCYVGSATQHGWRLITVVLHSPDYVHETSALMKYGFANFAPHVLAHAGDTAGDCPLQGGVQPTVSAIVKSAVQVVLRKGDPASVQPQMQYFEPVAPIAAGATLGVYRATVDSRVLYTVPLVAAVAVAGAPRAVVHVGAGGRHWPSILLASFFGLCLVSLRHGPRISTFTKSARRRGRRLAKSLRGDYHPR